MDQLILSYRGEMYATSCTLKSLPGCRNELTKLFRELTNSLVLGSSVRMLCVGLPEMKPCVFAVLNIYCNVSSEIL
jgi:hypothetical protein